MLYQQFREKTSLEKKQASLLFNDIF